MSDKRIIETPAQFADLQKECIEQVRFYIAKANDKLSIHLPMPKIVFSIKGTTAGRAWIGRNVIEFNPILLRDNVEDFLHRTPGHEVGHLAAHARFGDDIKAHGHEWQKVMWMLGLPATRCHNYDMTNVVGPGQVPRRRPTNNVIKTQDGIVRTVGVAKIIDFE